MSSEWTNPGFLASFSTESFLRADATKADPRRSTRTTSSPTSNGQEFNQRNWRLPQSIDLDGERLSRTLLENSSLTTACILQRLGIAIKEQRRTQSQLVAHHAQSVAVCVPRTLYFRATCVSTVDTCSFPLVHFNYN